MSKEMRQQIDKFKKILTENSNKKLNISDVISSKFNNIKCKLFGHNFIYVGRSNGNIWGWNEYKCKNCGAKMDSLD